DLPGPDRPGRDPARADESPASEAPRGGAGRDAHRRPPGAPSVAGPRPPRPRVRAEAAGRVPLHDARTRHPGNRERRRAEPHHVPGGLPQPADRDRIRGRARTGGRDRRVPRRRAARTRDDLRRSMNVLDLTYYGNTIRAWLVAILLAAVAFTA